MHPIYVPGCQRLSVIVCNKYIFPIIKKINDFFSTNHMLIMSLFGSSMNFSNIFCGVFTAMHVTGQDE